MRIVGDWLTGQGDRPNTKAPSVIWSALQAIIQPPHDRWGDKSWTRPTNRVTTSNGPTWRTTCSGCMHVRLLIGDVTSVDRWLVAIANLSPYGLSAGSLVTIWWSQCWQHGQIWKPQWPQHGSQTYNINAYCSNSGDGWPAWKAQWIYLIID